MGISDLVWILCESSGKLSRSAENTWTTGGNGAKWILGWFSQGIFGSMPDIISAASAQQRSRFLTEENKDNIIHIKII